MIPQVDLGGALTLVIGGFAVVLAIIWIVLPFVVFGISTKLSELIFQQRKINKLLKAQADRAQAIREHAGAVIRRVET